MPKKLRDASAIMIVPIWREAITRIGAKTLGMMWRVMIRQSVAPMVSAARMNVLFSEDKNLCSDDATVDHPAGQSQGDNKTGQPRA